MPSGLLSRGAPSSSTLGPRLTNNETWERPADWLPMAAITPGEQKYVMLFAVWNGSANWVCLAPTGTAYTVDWGDGSAVENVSSGSTVDHNFSWSGCSSSTLTGLGYRQALVTVTPQSGGTFTSFPLTAKAASASSGAPIGLLDFEWSAPTATWPLLDASASAQPAPYLQHMKAWSTATSTNYTNYFRTLTALRSVEGFDLTTPTSLIRTFLSCSSLIHGPALNTSSVTDFAFTFSGCARMVDVPTYDFSAATTVNSMYLGCTALRSVGAMNTGVCTNFGSTFSGCPSLTAIPALDTSAATSLDWTFLGCSSLATFPTLSTSNVTTMNAMFSSCTSLTAGPTLDTSKVTVGTSMFSSCASLRSIPTYDTSKMTTTQTMFQNCSALQSIPNLDLTACTNATNMFNGCSSLTAITLSNTSSIVTATGMFQTCAALQTVSCNLAGAAAVGSLFTNTTLRSVVLTGLRFAVSIANNLLDATALDALYTSLGTASGSQTVTVTNNPGTSGDTPTIATGKGWTVAGS